MFTATRAQLRTFWSWRLAVGGLSSEFGVWSSSRSVRHRVEQNVDAERVAARGKLIEEVRVFALTFP